MSDTQEPSPGVAASRPVDVRNGDVWQRKYYSGDSRFKSPVLASVMSLVPGLGQVYVGYYPQGFINILVVASLITMIANLASGHRQQGPGMIPLLAIFLVFYWLYNLVDAARRATLYNQAVAGMDPSELPQNVTMPGTHGSMFGGVLLLLLGTVFFGHTYFGYSLDWLQDWWPIGLVGMGAYLIYKAVQDRKK